MSLGRKLKILRLTAGKTQSEMGAIMNVSINTILRWERDLVSPRGSTLEALAEYFEVSKISLLSSSERTSRQYTTILEDTMLTMFREMPDDRKYKTLNYIKRMHKKDK